MKRIAVGVLIILASSSSMAASYTADLTVTGLWLQGTKAYVYTNTPPVDTCSYWGARLVFDHTTDLGKTYLSALLTAKISDIVVDFWYSTSTSPGTDQSNGCDPSAVSTIQQLRVR